MTDAKVAERPTPQSPDANVESPVSTQPLLAGGLAVSALLAACGGGSDEATAQSAPRSTAAAAGITPEAVDPTSAARFLAQAAMAITKADLDYLATRTYADWLNVQFPMRWTRSADPVALRSRKWWMDDLNFPNGGQQDNGFDKVMWRKMITSPDTLRQRVTMAWQEILVVSGNDLGDLRFRWHYLLMYIDKLEAHAFGNFKQMLYAVATDAAMGVYLTFRGNNKAQDAYKPDQNFARELMQLFTIGLYNLNTDGTLATDANGPVETYTQTDIEELSRVMTGWEIARFDDHYMGTGQQTPPVQNSTKDESKMLFTSTNHDSAPKTLLGRPIPLPPYSRPAGEPDMWDAIKILAEHPNTAPFICKQLIQRLVTSNPRPQYVADVATVFRANIEATDQLKKVVEAILLHADARTPPVDNSYGRVREPLLRMVAWARTFNAASNTSTKPNQWTIGHTGDPSMLTQSAGHSPTVFNFFRPGYVPPGLSQPAPEFQIMGQASIMGYINFMQGVVRNGIGDVRPTYDSSKENVLNLASAGQSANLVARLNLILTANQLRPAVVTTIVNAVNKITGNTNTARTNRVASAITMVMASADYIVQR